MGDIESMFYHVLVPEQERDYLRFYWWPNGDLHQKPTPYRMKVHLFGAVSSPSCSNYALRLTALSYTDEGKSVAAETILRNFYVDDRLKSFKSTEVVVDLIAKLTALCKKGGFNLTKWISNDQGVMQPWSPSVVDSLLTKYSSWNRLKRIMAWVLVFKRRFLQLRTKRDDVKVEDKMGPVTHPTPDMLEAAEVALVKFVQGKASSEELKCLSDVHGNNQGVAKSSAVYKLSPVLVDGIMRVGGRIDRAAVQFSARHPIILQKYSPVSLLLLDEAHRSVGHQGRNAMLGHVRQSHWIIGANGASKKIALKCVTCRKYQSKPDEQLMANLPAERLEANHPPFTNVGMDYFGPLMVKRGRAAVKRYGVLFTYFSSRAVHLEVASSLDTDSTINAIRRFMARRGMVMYIKSDNGTNLVGAEKELRQELVQLKQSKIQNTLCDKGIKWEFNPPTGSHFGGVWERLICSVRKIMYGLLYELKHRLDDEDLHTLQCEVEAILNSRPITACSTHPDDLLALTPNDMLLSQGAGASPGEFSKEDCYARKRWRRVQYLVNVFWKRWVSEYLPLLQERQKCLEPRRNVSVGDVVLLIDNTPRSSWALGRVVSTTKDSKGIVRVVQVKTATSVMQRPVQKLCLVLEADYDS